MSELAVAGLEVSVAERSLLSGVSFEVEEGRLVALVGPSGAGKSTLLRCIAGLIDARAGRVSLDGADGNQLGWPEWRRRVSYVAQRPVMLDGSVRANLERPRQYHSVQASGARDYLEWLERLGLTEEQLEQPARSLSVGEQQRVALVRALTVDPQVLLLDEPTSALDPAAVEQLEALLAELVAENGKAALVVTHDPAQARRLGDELVDLEPYMVGDDG